MTLRIPASVSSREALSDLIEGRLSSQGGCTEPVRLATRLIIERTSAWLVGSERIMDPVCFWQVFSRRSDGSVFARGGGSDRRG